jgi:signal transduction histidine kinase
VALVISRGHRRELNRALHELRRPLQALALIEDGGSRPATAPGAARRGLLELARSAATELDRVVNGGGARQSPAPVSCRELVLASLERWRPAAADAGGIRLFWDAGPALVHADPIAVAQAVDNLIANALEHGGPPVVVTGASIAGRVRVTIASGCAGRADGAATNGNGVGPRGGAGRGHGLEIVSRVASEHGGRFAICRTGSGCVAALELPQVETGVAQAA